MHCNASIVHSAPFDSDRVSRDSTLKRQHPSRTIPPTLLVFRNDPRTRRIVCWWFNSLIIYQVARQEHLMLTSLGIQGQGHSPCCLSFLEHDLSLNSSLKILLERGSSGALRAMQRCCMTSITESSVMRILPSKSPLHRSITVDKLILIMSRRHQNKRSIRIHLRKHCSMTCA